MAARKFVGLLIIISCITIGSCLQCYSCVREDKPDAGEFCKFPSSSELGENTIVNCSEGQNRCMITKMTQDNNEVKLFKRECAKEGDCSNSCTDPDEQMKDVVCDSCCEEDLCNKGEGPVPEAAKKSGASRIAVIRGLYTIAGSLLWFLW